MKVFIGCFLSAILGCMITIAFNNHSPINSLHAQNGPVLTEPENQSDIIAKRRKIPLFNHEGLSPEEVINTRVYDRVNKSVVNLTTKGGDSFFLIDVVSEGSGSGAVVDKNGHILTNFHVIEGAQQVNVTLHNGKTLDASFVGADPINDIAIIKIKVPSEELHPVSLGSSSDLQVGMRVFAIGNPFGLERTMTTGIISSLNRSLQIRGNRSIKSIIQIDAAVNPGNSGGPLINSHGHLIGINTAIASKTGQSAGIGFAIPINLAKRVIPQLIKYGRVYRPESGIQRVYEVDNGLLIAKMSPKGPAEKAGLRGPKLTQTRRGPFSVQKLDRTAADLIQKVDGKKVETADDFLNYIESRNPGDTVILTIMRDDEQMEVKVTLGGGDQGQPKKP